jgi:cell division protease FtsH
LEEKLKDNYDKILKWLKKNGWYVVIITILLISMIIGNSLSKATTDTINEITFNEFMQMVNSQSVEKVLIDVGSPKITFFDKNENIYITDNPKSEGFKRSLLEKNVKVEEISSSANQVEDFIWYTLRTVVMVALMLYMFKRYSQNMGSQKNMEEAQEKIPNVTFDNIAGNNEAKAEMVELVEFLKNPTKFTNMGAEMPKGVILYGPPGTGKTLTAKAIAGEAKVPFFSISGSDFVEMFVGMGAKRVRSLFDNARKKSPCIIFIDEIDAVGTKRGEGQNSEKDQTINALLKELDGFDESKGVLVIAATNRIENLDEALIRPGRFDKRIAINLPDSNDRLEILKVHAKNKKLSPEINFEQLSKLTIGFSGAGLESLLNEATILAVTKNKEAVDQEDIDDAYYKIVMQGDKKKNRSRKDEEIKLISWHEAGHALCSKLITENEVQKVTIIPSTSGAGGVTFITPKKLGLLSKTELENEVKVRYAGRVGELLLLGNEDLITTGASNDILQATNIIKQMISTYGMNDKFGMLNLTQMSVDNKSVLDEASKLSLELYNETVDLLTKNKHILEKIANVLIEKESLTADELDEIIYKNEKVFI